VQVERNSHQNPEPGPLHQVRARGRNEERGSPASARYGRCSPGRESRDNTGGASRRQPPVSRPPRGGPSINHHHSCRARTGPRGATTMMTDKCTISPVERVELIPLSPFATKVEKCLKSVKMACLPALFLPMLLGLYFGRAGSGQPAEIRYTVLG